MTKILSLSSTWLALIAVAIFAIFERILSGAVSHMSVDVYLLLRLPVMCLFLALFAGRLFGEPCRNEVAALLPHRIPLIYWARGGIWMLSLAALAVSMAVSPTQTFAYAWFILHPLWTLLFARPLGQKTPPMQRLAVPILLTVAGAFLFALTGGSGHEERGICSMPPVGEGRSKILRDVLGYVAPLLAGAFFALSNLLTSTVKSKTGANSTTISFYSAYVSLYLWPLVLGLFFLVKMPVLCLNPAVPEATAAIAILLGACVLVTIGTLLFTEAFAKPDANPAVLASLDLAIVLFAAIIGLALGDVSLTGPNALFSWKGAGLLLVLVGAAWSVVETERKPSSSGGLMG